MCPLCLLLLTAAASSFCLAGNKRLWVITAPSHNDNYLRMMEKQLEDTDQVLLHCFTFIIKENYSLTVVFLFLNRKS